MQDAIRSIISYGRIKDLFCMYIEKAGFDNRLFLYYKVITSL